MTLEVAPQVVAWFKAFALTAAFEVPLVVWLYGKRAPGFGSSRRAAVAFFAQLASHPAVWFVFPRLGLAYTPMVVAAELWAVGSETVFYAVVFGAGFRTAFVVAFAANAVSFSLGLVIRALTGWV